MRIAMISCYQYRDCHAPFFDLLDKFWPDSRTCSRYLITDFGKTDRAGWTTMEYPNQTWCGSLAAFARDFCSSLEPICLFLEDFFLTGPVNTRLVGRALEQLRIRNAGVVRLYPSPGANEDYGDPDYGLVRRGTQYRISCQTSIWRPDYLYNIARKCNDHGEASDFETGGSTWSSEMADEVLAFKRDSGPWPLDYLSSAVTRSQWNPDAKRLCDKEGISVDWGMRAFQGV